MIRTRKIRVILLFLIFVWIFQSMPSTISCVDRLQNQTRNYETHISSGTNIADILNSNSIKVKSPIPKLTSNFTATNLQKKHTYDFKTLDYSTYKIIVDHRSIIKQSNTHYFNGNKYKEPYLNFLLG